MLISGKQRISTPVALATRIASRIVEVLLDQSIGVWLTVAPAMSNFLDLFINSSYFLILVPFSLLNFLLLNIQHFTRFLRGVLFCFLFSITVSHTKRLLVYKNLRREFFVVAVLLDGQYLEPDHFTMALDPFDQLTFVIRVGVDDYLQVKIGLDEFVNNKFLAAQVAFVQVDSADQGLQRVAQDNLLELRIFLIVLYDCSDS